MRHAGIWFVMCTAVTLLLAGPTGCDEAADGDDVNDFDEAVGLEPGALLGKEDGSGTASLPVSGSYADTTVWTVKNQWEDTTTANAKKAGIAWGADSGLNWDEKFAAWIGNLKQIDAVGYGKTFEITTPHGKTLPAAKLDCADVAIALRASFAAWYNLPFVMTAQDSRTKIHFGHFGIRTATGIWNSMPRFTKSYRDYTNGEYPTQWTGDWPQDAKLRARGIQKGDEQSILGGLRTGAYLDEIHLNKRAGHFIRLLMIFTGSANLADSRNTYNLVPEALRAGDTLLYRRARNGSGHTMLIMRAEEIGDGQLQAENAYGNIPPDQPSWESAAATKRRFTNNEGGGPTSNSQGEVYAEIGGGLKRWRVAKNVRGNWVNTWMKADESKWINDRDFDRIAARPEQFDALLGEVTPERKRDLLLEVIESKRRHLRSYPASCSAREGREHAFDDLYALMSSEFNKTKAQVDQEFRTLEDYVFAELDYLSSKTCCWNSTTPKMFEIIMDYNRGLQADQCAAPEVFKAVAGDYAVFLQHAAAMGAEGEWVGWTADEECPQGGVLHDTEVDHRWTPWCDLNVTEPTPVDDGCVEDSYAGNHAVTSAETLSAGTYSGAICGGNDDFYAIAGTGQTLTLTVSFDNDAGDLDIELLDADGNQIDESAQTSDVETVSTATTAGATYYLHIFGYRDAEAAYTLEIAQ